MSRHDEYTNLLKPMDERMSEMLVPDRYRTWVEDAMTAAGTNGIRETLSWLEGNAFTADDAIEGAEDPRAIVREILGVVLGLYGDYPVTRLVFLDRIKTTRLDDLKLAEEYADEAEHQDGYTYWLFFSSVEAAVEDFDIYREELSDC